MWESISHFTEEGFVASTGENNARRRPAMGKQGPKK